MAESQQENPHGGWRAGAGRKSRGVVRLHLSPLESVVTQMDELIEKENARRVEADGEEAKKCTRTEMFEILVQSKAEEKTKGK